MKLCQNPGLVLFGMLLWVFQGCKKNNFAQKTQPLVTFSRAALEYVQLTQGKYLIYKDSASSLLDSVVVTTSDLGNIFIPETPGGIFTIPARYSEQFHLILSKFSGSSQTEWFNGSAVANLSSFGSTGAEVDLSETDGTQAFYLAGSGQSNDSVSVEGKMYYHVVVINYANGFAINQPDYKNTTYSWAKRVGIIKRTLIASGGAVKTYTLLRNN